jgi:hypothetical protein
MAGPLLGEGLSEAGHRGIRCIQTLEAAKGRLQLLCSGLRAVETDQGHDLPRTELLLET